MDLMLLKHSFNLVWPIPDWEQISMFMGEKDEAEDSSGGGDMMKINILILNGHMQLERMFETRHFAAFFLLIIFPFTVLVLISLQHWTEVDYMTTITCTNVGTRIPSALGLTRCTGQVKSVMVSSPDLVAGLHSDPLRNRPVLFLLLGEETLDSESLVGRLEDVKDTVLAQSLKTPSLYIFNQMLLV